MSHFVGIAFIPRDDDYEVNEDYSKKEQNLENMFSMGEAVYSSYLDELLAPYNEQDDNYCDISPELNTLATDYLQAYMNKDYIKLAEVSAVHLEQQRKWKENSVVWDMETKESSTPTLAEVDEELKPLFKLHRLFNPSDEKEMFDMNKTSHRKLFEELLVNTENYEINDEYQVFDHYLYNDEGYYDWYEVGGRWDNYFAQDNAVNVLEDISLLKGSKMIKKIDSLDWFATVGLKDEDIKNRNLDNQVVKSFKKDEFDNFITEMETDKEGKQREVRVVDEYYTTEELLDEEVEVRKYGMLAIITEKYGWEHESRMGWFGISEKDGEKDDDKEFIESEWDKLLDSRIDELLQDVDDNGDCKWVAVAVDFHI